MSLHQSLNGPQLEGRGVDQADIDQLLNDDIERIKTEADAAGDAGDPTDGIEFDAVPVAAANGADDPEGDGEDDFAGLSEEADADTIDAIFNS